jgi:uncharacterized membrane protein YhaH (DUF805 family)
MPNDVNSILGIESSPGTASPPPGAPNPNSPYYGYGGWLAFFCIVQIFIVPVIAVVYCALDVSALGSGSDSLDRFLVIEILGLLGIAAFGVYAGITLRRLRPGAVKIAKTYLVVGLAWAALKLVLAAAMLGGSTGVAVAAEEGKGLLQAIIGFAIWFSYFKVSKRVKSTFFGEEEMIHIVPPSN